MSPKVSIIIPAYNVAEYIKECLDSVLSQSFSDIEVIIIDDGSTDTTASIIKQYTDKRIRFFSQINKGLSATRNRGINEAKGKYILCVDSDDCIHAETIEMCYNKAETFQATAVSFDGFDFSVKDSKLTIHKNNYFDRSNKLKEGLYQGNDFFKETVQQWAILVCVPFYFMQRELFIKIPFQEGMLHEDVLFHYELLSQVESIYYLPKSFYERRVRSNSIVHTTPSLQTLYSYKKICIKILSKYKNANTPVRPLWKIVIKKNIIQLGKLTKRYLFSKQNHKYKALKTAIKILNNGNLSIKLQNYIFFTLSFCYHITTDLIKIPKKITE